MTEDTHQLYKGSTLHRIFAIGSVLFLLGVFWMVWADYSREWKRFQRQFDALEIEKAEKALKRAEGKLKKDEIDRLNGELAGEKKNLKAHSGEIRSAGKSLDEAETELYKLQQAHSIAKSYFEAVRYEFEEAVKHEHMTPELEKRLKATETEAENLRLKVEEAESRKIELEEQLGTFTSRREETREKIDELTRDLDQIRKNLDSLKPSFSKAILNAPMLDFIRPSLKIQQIVVDDLHDDYHFARVPKVDRCTTCHLAIDKPKGYDKEVQPFRSHPRMDLFLGTASAHPVEEFGCTVCHGGSGQDVTFGGAAHTPRNEEQEKEWIKKYGWQERKYWAHPMYSLDRVEASCVACHGAFQEIPEAPKLNAGRRLYRELGCFGCHETKGFENLRKVGPSLMRIGNKTDAGWVFKWVKDPLSFNPDTRMPKFFGVNEDASPDRENVEIDAIRTYLLQHSEKIEFEKPGDRGDVDRGKKLVNDLGCLGCHSLGEKQANDFGPNLSHVGSKVNRDWLVDWLKNPKRYWAETHMPSLRLTHEEALDIAEYLMMLKNPEFDQIAEPILSPDLLTEAVRYELALQMTQKQADGKIAVMDEMSKKLYLGERMINRYGCYVCHDIAGFENAKPIGTSLSEEGSKPVERFDFGLLKFKHSREAWFEQKLKEPRSFDHGKVKRLEERLRMPKFNLTDEEISSLITHLSSLTREEISLSKQHVLDARKQAVEKGWRMVRKFNCQGCHIVQGEGGNILSLYEDTSLGSPNVTGEGKKVVSNWLFNFLRHPATIRPWLKIRMPTFGFDHEQAATLVEFFKALDDVKDPFIPDDVPLYSPEKVAAGKQIFEALQCIKCHRFTKGMVIDESVDVSTLAPNLMMAKARLRHDWIVEWLKNPEELMPGTRMPQFWPDGSSPAPEILGGNAEDQMAAVREYVMNFQGEASPA
ncbi:MAG: c-type cytochrome [Candidatus Omnitrophica bacterium]|nr:c-type cytochrome [Candidatus Omnitrophota bacterium]